MRISRAIVAVSVGGSVTVAVLATQAAMSTRDLIELGAIAVAITAVGVTAGAVLLRTTAQRSIAAQVSAVAIITVAAVGLGAYVAARRMFISEHDLTTLEIVLIAAGTVGIVSALLLGARVGHAVHQLALDARTLTLDSSNAIGTAAPAARELTALQQELRTMQRRLADAAARERLLEASRRELVASVSHDLRTPLAGMCAILEALEDDIIDDQATKDCYLRTLHDEARQLSTLIDDLFELSRADAGLLRLRPQRVPLTDLVSDVLAGFAPIAAAKQIHLVGTVTSDPPEVTVSPPELSRALRNIVENAVRHTPHDGTIIVEVGIDPTKPPHAFVSVHDSGGGVAERDLAHVFDTAFQADPARRRGGAGLGLAIAKRFVEAHHGELTASNDGAGAKFTIRLPASHAGK
jgi:signal transduction histidine kinase